MSRVCEVKHSEAITIQARVFAYKQLHRQLQAGQEPIQTPSGLINNRNGTREFYKYDNELGQPIGSLFLRPHVADVLSLAKERFEAFVVTASDLKHATQFCNAFDSLDTEAKFGTWFCDTVTGRDYMGNWRLCSDEQTKRAPSLSPLRSAHVHPLTSCAGAHGRRAEGYLKNLRLLLHHY